MVIIPGNINSPTRKFNTLMEMTSEIKLDNNFPKIYSKIDSISQRRVGCCLQLMLFTSRLKSKKNSITKDSYVKINLK